MPELSQAEKFAREAAKQYAPPPGRGWKYYAKRFAIYAVSGYVLLCLIFFFFQNRIVYRPAVSNQLSVTQCGFGPTQGKDIELQTADGVTLSGWHLATNARSFKKLSAATLLIVYFGAGEGNRSARDERFCRFLSMGADVVCFDYRGFGDSEGAPNEEALAQDARAIWNYLLKNGVPSSSIVLYGESLGGAVAVRLAAELSKEKTPPAGIVVESSFSTLVDMERRNYPFLPVSLLLTQRYRSIDRIAGMESPLLMIHGQRDTAAPIASARAVFEAAPASAQTTISEQPATIAKRFVELPNCGHDDVGIENALEYDEAVTAFLKSLSPALTPAHHVTKKRPIARKDGSPLQKKQPTSRQTQPVEPP
jgi:hypothetical protein